MREPSPRSTDIDAIARRPGPRRGHRPRREDAGRHRPRHVLVDAVLRAARPRPTIERYDPSPICRCASAARSTTSTRPQYLGAEGGAPARPGDAARLRGRGRRARRRRAITGADPARCAVILGTGVGGLITLEEQIGVYIDKGAAPGQPVPRPDDDGERDRRHHRDAARLDGPEPLHLDRVRGERQRDRRGRAPHPRRDLRRRDDGRHRVVHDADRDLRVRAHDRAQRAQRRSGARVACRSTPTATGS